MSVEFDQYVEFVTEGPVVHPVALAQHDLESPLTLATVVTGYVQASGYGRAILSGEAELAFVFSEWTPAGGLPAHPGVIASMVLAGWTAKNIAAAYVIATKATLDAINATRTVALAIIRLSLVQDGVNPLAYDTPFTDVQVTVLSTWLNNHAITNAEFAALFGVSVAGLSNWLQTHPRWQAAEVVHEKFT